MKISGPFRNRDKQARGYPKFWYLSVTTARTTKDGLPLLDERGRTKWRRERPYYDSRENAEADIPRLRAQLQVGGVEGGAMLSRAQLEDLSTARGIVPPDEATQTDLANFWRLHHPAKDTRRLRELTPSFFEELKLRVGETSHLRDLKTRIGAFMVRFGERYPETITRDEIISYLLGLATARDEGKAALSGRSVLNQKRAVCNFFNWLLEKGHLRINPAAGIKKRQLPKIATKEIGFLSLPEFLIYLRAAERYDPEIVAHEVVQFFAGVRSDDEMGNFRAEWVLPATKEIVIPAEHAKISGRRDVINGLEENFWEWWEEYGPKEGPVRPKNYLQRWYRLRLLVEIIKKQSFAEANKLAVLPIKTLLGNHGAASLPPWPWNARRRTFCTMHVAKYQSADKTALILRHRGKASVLHESYRGLGVDQAMGTVFFDFWPKPVKRPLRPILPERGIIKLQRERAAAAAAGQKKGRRNASTPLV